MFWGRFLVRFEFLGSELTEEGAPLRWAKVGMNLHVFAWIFAICEFCEFPLKGRLHFADTPRSLRDLADFERAN